MRHRSFEDTIIFGTIDEVKQHLEQGAEIDAIDVYGFTPLIETAITGKNDIAELFIQQGADIDLPDAVGRTALHWAADNNNVALCQLLLENAANPNAYTNAGQPVLVMPYLRQQDQVKKLLYKYGASLHFAQDFVNTKLIGHRYELDGEVHIVNTHGDFILLDFEGFFLEVTLGIIDDSLKRFVKNYAAKHLRDYFSKLETIIDALKIASYLMKYQHYTLKIEHYQRKIDALLNQELLLIPVAYRGHAITCIKYKNLFIKCDRGEQSRITGSSVTIYRMTNPHLFTKDFIKNLIYKKNTPGYIETGMNYELGLEALTELPVTSQITGNCSWANVEASMPAMLFLLFLDEYEQINQHTIISAKEASLDLFHQWREWDKDRALNECVQSFYRADEKRRVSKAATLAAVLFQSCKYTNPKHVERAEKILSVILDPNYKYLLDSYIKVYCKDNQTPEGRNLMNLLDVASPDNE